MVRNLIGAAIILCATAGLATAGVDVNVRADVPVPPPPPPPGVRVQVGAPAPPSPVIVKKGDNGKHLGHYKKKKHGKKH